MPQKENQRKKCTLNKNLTTWCKMKSVVQHLYVVPGRLALNRFKVSASTTDGGTAVLSEGKAEVAAVGGLGMRFFPSSLGFLLDPSSANGSRDMDFISSNFGLVTHRRTDGKQCIRAHRA